MRQLILIGVMCLAGCQNVRGPFAPRSPERVSDPSISIPEQKCRGREQYALPDDAKTLPRNETGLPGVHSR